MQKGDNKDDYGNNNNNNNNNNTVFILWNQRVQTNRTFPNNDQKIIRDDDKETCVLMNVVTSGDRNVIKKEDKGLVKCKELKIEIQRIGDTGNNRGD